MTSLPSRVRLPSIKELTAQAAPYVPSSSPRAVEESFPKPLSPNNYVLRHAPATVGNYDRPIISSTISGSSSVVMPSITQPQTLPANNYQLPLASYHPYPYVQFPSPMYSGINAEYMGAGLSLVAVAVAAMDRDEEPLSARPALETESLRFLHVTVGSLLASYGWYILFSCILLYIVIQRLSLRLRALRQRQLDQAETVLEPDVVVKRQEALAAARLRMQEDLNAQVEKHKEKLRQLEEEKRRQKIEMWDSMQEGRSYKRNSGRPQEEDGPGPSTSSVIPKGKSDKKPLRGGGYNPLTGEGGGTCSWRPGRRGPSSGG